MIGTQQAQLWIGLAISWAVGGLYIPLLARPFPKRIDTQEPDMASKSNENNAKVKKPAVGRVRGNRSVSRTHERVKSGYGFGRFDNPAKPKRTH